MSQRPRAAVADGPVMDGPALVNGGGIQHREAGVSEVAMDVGFSDVGEPLAPTTTITTVAVQAGKAKIVLAILKVRPSSAGFHLDTIGLGKNSRQWGICWASGGCASSGVQRQPPLMMPIQLLPYLRFDNLSLIHI